MVKWEFVYYVPILKLVTRCFQVLHDQGNVEDLSIKRNDEILFL